MAMAIGKPTTRAMTTAPGQPDPRRRARPTAMAASGPNSGPTTIAPTTVTAESVTIPIPASSVAIVRKVTKLPVSAASSPVRASTSSQMTASVACAGRVAVRQPGAAGQPRGRPVRTGDRTALAEPERGRTHRSSASAHLPGYVRTRRDRRPASDRRRLDDTDVRPPRQRCRAGPAPAPRRSVRDQQSDVQHRAPRRGRSVMTIDRTVPGGLRRRRRRRLRRRRLTRARAAADCRIRRRRAPCPPHARIRWRRHASATPGRGRRRGPGSLRPG